MKEKRVHAFANGSEWMVFLDTNCERCKKANHEEKGHCALLDALYESQSGDGMITLGMAKRLGKVVDGKKVQIPNCPEREET